MSTKYFEAISVDKELPEKEGHYSVIYNDGKNGSAYCNPKATVPWLTSEKEQIRVIYWLKEATGTLLSQEQVAVIGSALKTSRIIAATHDKQWLADIDKALKILTNE